jgi:hypothetical protein
VLDRRGKPTGVYTYKVAAAVRTLDTLARVLGLFPDRPGHAPAVGAKAPPVRPGQRPRPHARLKLDVKRLSPGTKKELLEAIRRAQAGECGGQHAPPAGAPGNNGTRGSRHAPA